MIHIMLPAQYLQQAGARLYHEARLADEDLRDRAGASGMKLSAYRAALQIKYRKMVAIVYGQTGYGQTPRAVQEA